MFQIYNRMAESNKSYRIRTEVGVDTHLDVQLNQSFDNLEILSLKIGRENIYRLHTAGYGCVVGRVVANGNFGIPNAKVSIFISADTTDNDDSILSYLYPYSSVTNKNDDGIRYNLLTEEQISDCHRNVGTFPSKRKILDDTNVLEVYDKYYKFTTSTNASGDFMIFGVPVGNQVLHTDIDLSDIGMLSQKPRDMIYKGYTMTQFENANQFKSSTDLDSLSQIISQNTSVYVYPFWGDEDEGDIKITRSDVEVNYKFEPTCIFMGSLITDERSEGISKKCIPSERMGKMDRLTTGQGTIEMIRKTPDGSVEEYSVQGNQLIDGNGTWCYQIPMNLDYMATDEYGNLVPTDDPSKGIPTRARVRFRVSLNDFDSDYENNHLSKLLVPNNPKDADHLDYVFGTLTQDEEDGTGSFRDLFWNNVYTVKSYIPRIQKGNNQRNKRFTGIKQVNVNNSSNPIPYNNMRVQITFMFSLQCAILKLLIAFAKMYNKFIVRMLIIMAGWKSGVSVNDPKCMTIGDGACPDLEGWYFAPGCGDWKGGKAWRKRKAMENTLNDVSDRDSIDEESIDARNSDDDNYCLTNQTKYLMQCIEINLAMEYDVIQFDFYNDWINGLLYIPRWFVNIRKKRKYFFGLIRSKAKVQACMEGSSVYTRRFVQQCAMDYTSVNNGIYSTVVTANGCKSDSKQKCHKAKGRKYVKIFKGTKHGGGIVHNEKNMDNKNLYYFRPAEWINNSNNYNTKCNLFATDIVLLGSFKDCDNNGIPQAFKELVSTSYQLPSNLASTNMDNYGFMYGNGVMCTKSYTTNEVTKNEDTFENYRIWQSRQDFKESEPNLDPTEYPITEAAGIDWGYEGPGQEAYKEQNKALYNPGGHFLGISCKNAEVNIKSCVNLSRICEIGAMMSQRQAVMKADYISGQTVYSWAYLTPTGLISKDEITDANFRNIFATMNYNHLATEVDEETGCRRYKMILMQPTNFNGELSRKINSTKSAYFSVTETNGETQYRRALEDNSEDYYLFRMGGTGKEHFLINSGNKVSLPVYDNSYYFYFGIKNGATAFDRFMNEYYAQCPSRKKYESQAIVETIDATLCKKNDGEVKIAVKDVEAPYTFDVTDDKNIKYNLKEESEGIYTLVSALTFENNSVNSSTFTVKNLSKGEYNVDINGNGGEDLSFSFSIGEKLPDEVENMAVYVTDFVNKQTFTYEETGKVMNGEFSRSNGGYIEVKIQGLSDVETVADDSDGIKAVYVYNDEYYYLLNGTLPMDFNLDRKEIKKFGSETIENSENLFFSYLWRGNDEYTVVVIYHCANGTDENLIIETVYANMDGKCDYYIGDTDCTGSILRNAGINTMTAKWYEYPNLKGLSSKEEWSLRKGLYYTGSVYNRDGGAITVGLINAVPPFTTGVTGMGELTMDDEGNHVYVSDVITTDEEASKSGYSVNIENFMCPTVMDNISFANDDDNSLKTQGITFLNDSTEKIDYNFSFSDSSDNIVGDDDNEGGGDGGDTGGTTPTGETPIKYYTIKSAPSGYTRMKSFMVNNEPSLIATTQNVKEGSSIKAVYMVTANGYNISTDNSKLIMGTETIMGEVEPKFNPTQITFEVSAVTDNITIIVNSVREFQPKPPTPITTGGITSAMSNDQYK